MASFTQLNYLRCSEHYAYIFHIILKVSLVWNAGCAGMHVPSCTRTAVPLTLIALPLRVSLASLVQVRTCHSAPDGWRLHSKQTMEGVCQTGMHVGPKHAAPFLVLAHLLNTAADWFISKFAKQLWSGIVQSGMHTPTITSCIPGQIQFYSDPATQGSLKEEVNKFMRA